MDEKDLVKRIRNSFRAKKSMSEILSGFQKRGYKLAYADELITKAKRPKRIAIALLITFVLFFSLTSLAYTVFFDQQKTQISNPLSGFIVTEGSSASSQQVTYDQIEITPDFISFLLNEIGVWQLHKNPLTLEAPIINFKIGTQTFYSKIGTEIETHEGSSDVVDLQFNTNKQDLIDAILSGNPKEIFKKSIVSGRTQIDVKASEAELFAKGYLGLYESLNS
ncbi:MAG: hypothetical protein ABIF18_02195 [archaeon]